MQDETHYVAPTLTIEDARALAARVAAVVSERDELRRELHDLRLILAELASLREFIIDDIDDRAPFTAVAATNGHLATARVQADAAGGGLRSDDAAPELDDAGDAPFYQPTGRESALADDDPAAPELDAAGEASSVDIAGDADVVLHNPLSDEANAAASKADTQAADDAEPGPDTTAVVVDAERPGETNADDGNDHYSGPSQNETTADERPGDPDTAASHTGDASTADAAPERPAPDTLLGRILNALETSTRPRRPWQLQQELSLSRAPSAELSRLISQGHVVRLREGVYGAVGRTYDRLNA